MIKISQARKVKMQEVAEITEVLKSSVSIVLLDYRGIKVEEANQLRRQLDAASVKYKVYKNTLIQLAANDIGLTGLDSFLTGPTALAFSPADPVAPAKNITEAIKKLNKMQVKAGVLEGKVISAEDVKILAELPSKSELVAKLLGSLNTPVANLVGVLSGPVRALVNVLNSIKDNKETSVNG